MKRLTLILLLLSCIPVCAQSYKGIWQGYIIGSAADSYRSGYCLDIKKQNDNILSGRAYFYHRTLYNALGTFDFIGTVNGNECKITELKILDSAVNRYSAYLCVKLMNLHLITKNNADYLEGNWAGDIYSKEQCDPGEVYLRRYKDGDAKDAEPIPEHVMEQIKEDPSKEMTFLDTKLGKPLILSVRRRTITLEISDYLKADNDTVSVYYNRVSIAQKLRLLKKPKKIPIRLDKLSGLNEIIMYANNLGLIPPNTSTLIVDDGTSRQKVNIESTRQISAVIYLRYEPSP